jgi:hypothetical protein
MTTIVVVVVGVADTDVGGLAAGVVAGVAAGSGCVGSSTSAG